MTKLDDKELEELMDKVFIINKKDYVKLVKRVDVLKKVIEVLENLGYADLMHDVESLRIVDDGMAEVDPKIVEADVPAPIIVLKGGSPSVSWGWLGSHLVLLPKGTKSVYIPRTREYRYYHYASGFGVAVLIGNAYVPTQVYIFRIKKEQ